MSKFLTDKLQRLVPYVPGEQLNDRNYIKLNTNESPFPPSPLAVKMASDEAARLMLYPDPDLKALVDEIAEYYGVSRQNVIATNGSDEVLDFAFKAYVDNARPALFANHTYGFYKVFASANDVPYTEMPLRPDFSIDVDDYIQREGTVFIANPNAPTGLALSLAEIERLVASNPDRIVVVDEAYVDFGAQSAVCLTQKYDNVLVTQTFSKSRSMAGARLGFGIASKAIIDDLNRIRYAVNPYNVNRMTACAGIGAIRDDVYFKANCAAIIKNREWTIARLRQLGFECTDSMANFVFAKSDRIGGKELYQALKNLGVLVRHFDKDGIRDYVRITVGSEREMQILIEKINNVLENGYENV